MKVSLDYSAALDDISAMIPEMQKLLEGNERKALSETGKAVKRAVESVMVRSDIEARVKNPKNHDGTPHTHMIDDVRFKVKKGKNGDYYVSIGGGKNTGYKWHMLNDGWTDRGGVFHMGTKFMEKAVRQAEGAIDLEIDKLLKKVAG